MSEAHATVIVGGGQAGLALSYCLSQLGLEHVMLVFESRAGPMSAGVFTVPTSALVAGSVVWYRNVAWTLVAGAMLQPCAVHCRR